MNDSNLISEFQIIVLSDKQIVYEVNGKELTKTENESIEEYSVMKCKNTYKTFAKTLKNSNEKLTKEIGHGGFGKIYEVFFQTQYYAVKKIFINDENRSYLDDNSELQIMKQLKSDFIVILYDYWTESVNDFDFLYIQMELCDQTLKDIIETKNTWIPRIIDYMIRTEIFGQLLFALNYLHSMTPKVIHRDIKPSNVLIKYHNDHAQCKLCDFGLSKILEKESSNTPYIGTSGYKAPEIRNNKYNEKIDIFSLGISMQEFFKKLMLIKNDEHGVLDKFKNLKSVITTMIHGSPEERPSADDIIDKMNDLKIEVNKELIDLLKIMMLDYDYHPLKFLNKVL